MEPTQVGTAPATVVQTTPAPTQNANTGVTGGDLFKTLVHSLIAGFAIGLGVLAAVKMAGKKLIVKDNKAEGTSAMSGYPPMYPPRNMPNGMQRPPMYPMHPSQARPPYMMANGEETFNINTWVKRDPETPVMENEHLGEVQD